MANQTLTPHDSDQQHVDDEFDKIVHNPAEYRDPFENIIDQNYSPKELEKLERKSAKLGAGDAVQSPAALAANEAKAGGAGGGVLAAASKLTPAGRLMASIGGASRSKKVWAGGGIAAVILTLLISIAALFPLKLPGILNALRDNAGQRVEQVTEARAERIIARAILSKFGSGGGVVITGNGPVSSLIATLRTKSFEQRLANSGLKIEAAKGGGVKLTLNGKPLGDANGLKNEQAILDALKGDTVGNNLLKTVVREQIPSYRWLKRAKFVKFLRLKYGVSRFGIKNSDKATPDERVNDINEQRFSQGLDQSTDDAVKAVGCLAGEACPDDLDKQGTTSDINPEHSTIVNSGDTGADGAVKASADGAKKGIPKVGEKVSQLLTKEMVKKVGSKAIPVIGWIDLAALVDHMIYTTSDKQLLVKIPAYFKENAYARMFATWAGYADQNEAGLMDSEIVQELAQQMEGNASGDPAGAEESKAINASNGYPDQGIGLTESQKVNSSKASTNTAQQLVDAYVASTPPVTHALLNTWYVTVGKLLAAGGDLVAAIVKNFIPQQLQDYMGEIANSSFKFILDMLAFSVDPTDNGAKLANDIHAGATVSFDRYCEQQLGCRRLTPAQASAANQTIAKENQAYDASKGFAYNYLDTSNPRSFINKVAIALPFNKSSNQLMGSVSSGLGLIAELPTNLGGLFSKPLAAAAPNYAYVNLYNSDPFGGTGDDLAKDVAPQAVSGEECPQSDGTVFNNCVSDKAVAESMICGLVYNEADCGGYSDSASPTDNGAGSAYTSAACKDKATIPTADNIRILCEAEKYDPYGYLWAGGHSGTAAAFVKRFKSGYYQPGKSHILDCSGLVRIAIYEAFGADIGGDGANDAVAQTKYFTHVPIPEVKPGDMVVNVHHIAIVESIDPSKKKIYVFEASTDAPPIEDNIHHGSYTGYSTSSWGGESGYAVRYIGPKGAGGQ